MPVRISDPVDTANYQRIPFAFTEKLSASQVFVHLPDEFSPLERILLQSTGNLQRILSAYFNKPSRIEIIKNELISSDTINDEECITELTEDANHEHAHDDVHYNFRFKRKILMYFGDTLAYEAESLVAVKDQQVLDLLHKQRFGLGQIFSHLQKVPQFSLICVGRHGSAPGSSFWRDYSLTAPGAIECFIRETFVEGLFEPCKDNSIRDGTVWYA